MVIIVSLKCSQITFYIIESVALILTLSLTVAMYSECATQSWILFSTIQLRTIILIHCVVSTMICLLGYIGVMKFETVYHSYFTSILLIPIILASVQMYYTTHYEDSTKMIFNVANKTASFLSERTNVYNEFKNYEEMNVSCPGCTPVDFTKCVDCAVKFSPSFMKIVNGSAVWLLIMACLHFLTHLVYILLFKLDDSEYQEAVVP